jgi:hypothetical protein
LVNAQADARGPLVTDAKGRILCRRSAPATNHNNIKQRRDMNPRIYKKQAKRAVELLRSFNGWREPIYDADIYKVARDEHPCGSWDKGIGIDGCPVIGWMSSTPDGSEWTEYCPRIEWMDLHYWTFVVPDGFDGDDLPSMTLKQRRERFNTRQIAKGWQWRGGRAIRV